MSANLNKPGTPEAHEATKAAVDANPLSIPSQRKFLHDLANPLAIAMGMLEAVLDEGQEKANLTESQIRRLEKVRSALDRITSEIEQRRTKLIKLAETQG